MTQGAEPRGGEASERGLCASVVVIKRQGAPTPYLPSLMSQSCPQPYEVLVVEGGNRAQARNHGARQSQAPAVAYIDADCEAPQGWLQSLVNTLATDPAAAGVGGVSMSHNPSTALTRAIDGVFSTYLGSLDSPSLVSYPSPQRRPTRALSTHNCIYRREALIEAGGFDPRYEVGEDTDASRRLRERGGTLILDKSIHVHHDRALTLRGFSEMFYTYGVGRARSCLTDRGNVDPRILALFLLALAVASTMPLYPPVLLGALLLYAALALAGSIAGSSKAGSATLIPLMMPLYAVQHASYLAGLFAGLLQGPWGEPDQEESALAERRVVHPSQ
jgi:succinoglycan biosynthesis protein ExoA